ncbi:hypothetical protein ATCM_03910 [Stenotrophomonas sp. ATCM1_4]|nr:hypothetical protein ATCM_03910 [Stenotrophomonas sp. ATCM1_4]
MDRGILAVLIGGLSVAAGQVSAQDSRWSYVGTSIESHMALDTQSVERSSAFTQAWVREESKDSTSHVVRRTQYRFDCPGRQIGTITSVSYAPSGAVSSTNTPSSVNMLPVVPDSMGENAWAMACPAESRPIGLKQVGDLGNRLRASDPNFQTKFEMIQDRVAWIQENLPATIWARAILEEWEKLP